MLPRRALRPRRRGVPWSCGAFALSVGLASVGCSIDAPQGEVGIYYTGEAGEAGAAGAAGAADSVGLTILIRDFKVFDAADPSTNPDFHNIECDRDVAASTLGSDSKPVYQAPTNTLPTFGKAVFDQWYRDVPGTNIAVAYPLTLTVLSGGLYEYDSRKTGIVDTSTGVSRRVFLPIDDGTPYATAFGNQGEPHNLAFTGELHAVFTFPGQGSLKVRSDDDLYVFVAGNLAVNLGGIHAGDTLELDVSGLGLTPGNEYPFDLFYAERAGKTGDLLLNTSLMLRPATIK